MKWVSLTILSILSTVNAAPAIIWKHGTENQPVVHTSDVITSNELFESVLHGSSRDSELEAVIFLFGRGENGTESLSQLSSAGALPGIAVKYEEAHCFHHHVSGLESPSMIESLARRANPALKVVQASLEDFNNKLTLIETQGKEDVTTTSKKTGRRARELASANVLIVNVHVDEDIAMIDPAVVKAIEHESVGSVVVTAVRSVKEVIAEREARNRSRRAVMEENGRRVLAQKTARAHRRLEDQQGQGDDAAANDDDDEDMSGIYYVSMTPNILAGLLFTLLYATITLIALSCMNMISGQDVYVNKMPSIGREA